MGKLRQTDINLLPVGSHGDGDGLYLLVQSATSRSWAYRYSLNNKQHWAGLGPANGVSLAQARRLRDQLRAEVRGNKVDIVAERRRERQAANAKTVTFAEVAESYISAQASQWRGDGSAHQWRQSLGAYVLPRIGGMPVGEITRSHVIAILDPIWITKPDTGRRVRARIESIIDWAVARGHRSEELANPAARRLIEMGLPKQPKNGKAHHAALPYADVPAFMRELKSEKTMTALALRFAVLTAARIGEVTNARWSEIDRVEAAWTIPAERMKSGRAHRVPLTQQALDVLDRAAAFNRQSEYIFVNASGKPLTPMACWIALRRLGEDDATIHGFRSAFKDWCREETDFDGELSEAALAHVLKDQTEAAYARGTLFGKRRRLMEAWADYCE